MRFALLLLLAGCLPRHDPAPWVTRVRVEGPDPHGWVRYDPDLPPVTDDQPHRAAARETAWQARQVVQHPVSHWWQYAPLAALIRPRRTVDPDVLRADRDRVAAWFADHGWRDAVVTLQVEAPGPRRRTATFRVTPGDRTHVRHELSGIDALPPQVRRALAAALPPTGAYDRAAVARTAEHLSRVLQASGYGRARVVADADPDDGVQRYRAAPGHIVRMGPVRWIGLDSLDRAALDRVAASVVRGGAPWDGQRLEALADHLEARPGIAEVAVTAEPGPGDTAAVVVSVTEAPAFTWTPRFSLGANGALLSATVGAGFEAHNVGRRLVTTRGHADAGYRVLPTSAETPGLLSGNHGPTGEGLLEWDLPLAVVGRLGLYARAEGVLDVRRGYHSVEPEGATGLAWSTDAVHLTAAAVVDHDQYYAYAAQRPVYERWFGEDDDRFLPTYTLAYPELRARLDTLDRALDPRRGVWATAGVVPAARFRGRSWSRADADLRAFFPAHPRVWTLVARAWGAVTHWQVPDAPRLFGLRYHLGGPYDMRAWSFRRVSSPGYDGGVDDTRIGGNVLLYASAESRHRVHPHLTVIPFVDIGRTWESLTDRLLGDRIVPGVDLRDLTGDVGLGVDVPTPLGVLRTAAAWQPVPTTRVATPAPRWTWQANLDMRL